MSDYNRGSYVSYVKDGEFRTCDECGVIQRTDGVERVLLHGKQRDRCRDRGRCAQWKAQLEKERKR